MTSEAIVARAVMAAAVLLGGCSLALFAAFLVLGPVVAVRFGLSQTGSLAWDVLLSVLFFAQHSGMIRASFEAQAARFIARPYLPALYAVASGITLLAVVLLWQPAPPSLLRLEGVPRTLARGVSLVAVLGFAWAVRVLGRFDPFGQEALRAHVRSRPVQAPEFVARGPYLWVRHPLYFLMLVLVWSAPDVTADRLLFDLLWTAWILVGTRLEERDLVGAFGERYRRYQREVPMLLPFWPARSAGPPA